jgi:hypothetical protein
MSYKSTNAQLFSIELMNGLVLILLCGLFGWTATPACFQVITRAILYELWFRFRIFAEMYVDDIMGFSLTVNGESERAETDGLCTTLCGPKTIANEKTCYTDEVNPCIDMIGYRLNLQTEVVSISRRNTLRALYAFTSVDMNMKVPVKALERMASLASRYGMILPVVRPFARALYDAYAGLNRHVSVDLKNNAKRAIHVWRAMLCILVFREQEFGRPFDTFIPRSSRLVIHFDACLEGMGVIFYEKGDSADGCNDVALGGCAASFLCYGIGSDSSYQNACEFVAAVIGLIIAINHVRASWGSLTAVDFRGDSVTALKWLHRLQVKGKFATRSASVLAMIATRYNVHIEMTEHVAAADNEPCDALSRGKQTVQEVLGVGSTDLGSIPRVRKLIDEAITLCNPCVVEEDEGLEVFEEFWGRLIPFVDSIASSA